MVFNVEFLMFNLSGACASPLISFCGGRRGNSMFNIGFLMLKVIYKQASPRAAGGCQKLRVVIARGDASLCFLYSLALVVKSG